MKVGDIVILRGAHRPAGLVVDLDLCNGDAYVMWETKIAWSEIKYLEVIS